MENIFSWSKSRAEEFQECQRKYFYDRYVSWGGWDQNAPQEARLAYVLKNLKNRWAWKGETVHHLIEEVLKSLRAGKSVDFPWAENKLTEIMRRDYRSSKAKKYFQEPKKSVGLFEHEYNKPVSDATWKAIHDEALTAVKNFFESDFYQELQQEDKKNWLMIEDLEEFEYSGAKIYVKLDFARQKDGCIEIYDWKTGKEEKQVSIQVGAYAVYAMQKWKVPLEKVKAYLFYLSSPAPVAMEQELTPALIEATKQAMSESIEAMHSLLSDPKKNIPKDRKFFQYTQNERLCQYCNFLKICEKYTGNTTGNSK